METEHGEGWLWTLEGCAYFMEQPYACTLHEVFAANCMCRVGVLVVHASCDCVTSVYVAVATRPYNLGKGQ